MLTKCTETEDVIIHLKVWCKEKDLHELVAPLKLKQGLPKECKFERLGLFVRYHARNAHIHW